MGTTREAFTLGDPVDSRTIRLVGKVLYATPAGDVSSAANPNGSLHNIAGIINERGNVLGMMPHPERSAETLLGGDDGLVIFRSMIESAVQAVAR